MNISKFIFTCLFGIVVSSLNGQSSIQNDTIRKVAMINRIAAVIELDQDFNIIEIVMEIPDYFNNNYIDAYYISQSFIIAPHESSINADVKEKDVAISNEEKG